MPEFNKAKENLESFAQKAKSAGKKAEMNFAPSLNPKLCLQLAAPHTWPASILPALIGCSLAANQTGELSVTMTVTLLLICVFMQSAANTFNDYFDFIKGTDTDEDFLDPTDSVLVYNNVSPKDVLHLAILYLAVPFILGIYVIVKAGLVPLFIALIAAVFVVIYSAGKTPLSYLPIGEVCSGFVMGGLIVVACYHALSGEIGWKSFLWALPTMCGVALIMMTNNTCDIEKDIQAKRRTLPALLGREKSIRVYRIILLVWMCSIVFIVAVFFTKGVVIELFMLAAAIALLLALFRNPFTAQSRIAAMTSICDTNIVFGAFYAAGILAGGLNLVI